MMQFEKKKFDVDVKATWIFPVLLSLAFHLLSAFGLSHIKIRSKPLLAPPVKITVRNVLPDPPKVEKMKLEPKTMPAPSTRKPKTVSSSVAPIQGVTKESASTSGSMAVPIGNTLMIEDKGIRKTDVQELQGDLSSPAKLIASTLVVPPYTDDALDAQLEGVFVVDVYVNIDGSVKSAELQKKIGYGMDDRVLKSVLNSKFSPRKNKFGVEEEGWTELKFKLTIP